MSSSPNAVASAAAPPKKRSALKFLCGFLIGLVLAGSAGGAYVLHLLWQQLPTVDHLADYDPLLPLRIYAADGSLLAEFGEERREFVPIGQIPLHMRQALLAIEDARFYEHSAVDFTGLARAALRNVVTGEHSQGASTITMQVARVFFLSRVKTYSRKLMEILLAYKLEATYSKDKILELYMNQIYLGERAYGFAAAASVYFDKTLEELTVAEAAMLAGLPKAPSAYNPVANRERATVRQQYILQRMHALGYLDTATYEAASAEVLTLRTQQRSIDPAAAFAVEQARKLVVDRFGDEAYSLGLDVVTTLRPVEQQAATRALRAGLLRAQESRGYAGPEARLSQHTEATRSGHPRALRAALAPYWDSGELRVALVREASQAGGISALLRDGTRVQIPRSRLSASAQAALAPDAPQRRRIAPGAVIRVVADARQQWSLAQRPGMEGALVSMDTDTGEILALTGGFDQALNQFDHAVQALRQPGSTFKPFIFSAALEKGYAPGTLVDDSQRVVTPAARGRAAWRPRNYGGNYEGFISARRGLARSKNMVAVNLMEAAGAQYVQQFATRFGFDPALNPPRLPLALGAGAVTPLQLTQAYAVFANGGTLVQPRLIRKVSERGGEVLYEAQGPSPRATAVSERNAFVLDSMLRDVVEHGTGRRAKALGRPDVAGKTGTSNDARDVWFAGYSSGVASVVWIGYDQPRSLGRHTGGTLALPVWTEYMAVAVLGRQPVQRTMPFDLMRFGDDYLYPEYVFGTCVDDSVTFVQSPFECSQTGRRPQPEGSLELG
ncbi:MAG: penicillin-binding protein [Acidovorax sp. SCN 65-108]|nr:MAG: penicillin-binding protein [Acidovorax sp. SCN 65-108]OJV67941.1 MAG: penicillin-binding protein [Burkholderiales bacterium 64-34]